MRRYQTSIKALMTAKTQYQITTGNAPIFLSDWDSDYNSVQMPTLKIDNSSLSAMQKYYFWTDEWNFRESIQNFFTSQYNYSLSTDKFAIGTNGTASIMLALTALKEAGKRCALIITPIYFSTLNLLDELEFEVVEFNLSPKNDFVIDAQAIEQTIINNRVDVLIVTNPIFGTGIEISIPILEELSNICNSFDICLLMDYVYGGLPWAIENPRYYIFNLPVYKAISSAEQYIFIESISKRVFLNGAKFALVFSNPRLMRRILRLSVFMAGSMSLQQVSLVPQLYSNTSVPALTELITENAITAHNRYRMLKCLLSDSQIRLSNACNGYFALASIPKKLHKDDIEYAMSILNKTGVLTTPHSRYLLSEDNTYSFRINLLLNKNELIEGMSMLKNLI